MQISRSIRVAVSVKLPLKQLSPCFSEHHTMPPVKWVGVRYWALVGGLVSAIGLTMYPIAIDPYFNPEKWRMYFCTNLFRD